MAHITDDGEFRGSTKQSLQDIREDIRGIVSDMKDIKTLVADNSFAMNQQIEAMVKVMNDKEDRYNQKFVRVEQFLPMDDELKLLKSDVSFLKRWVFTLLGGGAALWGLIAFFGDTIRKGLFR